MNTLNIIKYQDKYRKDILPLIAGSFESKFTYRSRLSKEDVEKMLDVLWGIKEDNSSYIHYIAILEDRVVGVILVQIAALKQGDSLHLKKLLSLFGLVKTMQLLLILSTLDSHKYRVPYVEHLAVDSSVRGHGIGKQLLTAVDQELIGLEQNKITLMVTNDNPAKRLYTREGYEVTHKHKSLFKGFLINEKEWSFMEKSLSK